MLFNAEEGKNSTEMSPFNDSFVCNKATLQTRCIFLLSWKCAVHPHALIESKWDLFIMTLFLKIYL